MKVLFVIGQLDIGGIECWLDDLTDLIALKKPDVEIYVLVDKPHKGVLEDKFSQRGITILRVSSSKISKLSYIKNLFFILRKYKFDVVHSNVSFTNGINSLLAFITKVPIRISHIHSNRNNQKLTKLKKLNYFFLKIFIELFSTHKIAVSEQSKSNYLSHENVLIMPCGISLEKTVNHEDVKARNGWDSNSILLCSVGRLESVKNHEFIIKLMPNLPLCYKYVIAGEGSLREELEQLVRNLNLQDRVILIGNITSTISFLKKNADILLFPSHHEGFGVVAVEAQLASIPVIASTNVPISTKISNAIYYIPSDDKITWIEKIKHTTTENIKLTVDSNIFDIKNNYEKLIRIYAKDDR
ncbi:glycosyltransferase [Providencia sp. PROV129]|uniref:glycosyltransferase n=1 Tax=Providencia sp. PROV129 TaxID=2949839 RepID=UPI002349875E|nr:glycosyltransferase [Providencia sp. PROV129]